MNNKSNQFAVKYKCVLKITFACIKLQNIESPMLIKNCDLLPFIKFQCIISLPILFKDTVKLIIHVHSLMSINRQYSSVFTLIRHYPNFGVNYILTGNGIDCVSMLNKCYCRTCWNARERRVSPLELYWNTV